MVGTYKIISLGKMVVGGVNWIHLAQDRDLWRAFVHGNELYVSYI
jgi:hypothetical protein